MANAVSLGEADPPHDMRQRLAGLSNAARTFSAPEKVADSVLRGERWLLDRAPVGREGVAPAQLETELNQLEKR